nr:MAG TPA: hypothetical protein [Caudoviricetes sp.]
MFLPILSHEKPPIKIYKLCRGRYYTHMKGESKWKVY